MEARPIYVYNILEARRKTHVVKRLAYGNKRVESAKKLLRPIASEDVMVQRDINSMSDSHLFACKVNDIQFEYFDFYDRNAPGELYVAVKSKQDYEALKKAMNWTKNS